MFRKISKFAAVALLAAALPMLAQDGRRVVREVKPSYPEIARDMHVNGSVRLQVTIAPNGKVTEAKALGGHPLLINSAVEAVKQWQYEAAPQATSTTVVFNFSD